MGRFKDRARGVAVRVLDLSALEADALAYRQRGIGTPGEFGYVEPKPLAYEVSTERWAIAEKKDGTLAALTTEGTGYDLSESYPLVVGFRARYHVLAEDENGNPILDENGQPKVDESKTQFDMAPFVEATLDLEKLKSIPVAEEVDLADFIRTFGDRLERNFWVNYEDLS